jgi:uncharacterized alpha/beta hydrolase family protein
MGQSNSNPQVTISHCEYQELLEAQRALDKLERAIKDDESVVIKVHTDYHSARSHDKRDFYFVANPDEITKMLTKKLDKLIKQIETMQESYVGHSFGGKPGMFNMVKSMYDKQFPSK